MGYNAASKIMIRAVALWSHHKNIIESISQAKKGNTSLNQCWRMIISIFSSFFKTVRMLLLLN
jgi:hypothetical protein